MKKTVFSVLAAVVLSCIMAVSVLAENTATTIASDCNVRRGPGLSYESYATLPAGTSVVITDWNSDRSWAYLGASNGIQGWVSASMLNGYNGGGSGSSTGNITVGNYTMASAGYMRSGPSTSYQVYTTVPAGTPICVTQVSDQWGYCTYNGCSGWVWQGNIAGFTNTGSNSSSGSSSQSTGTYYTTAAVNFRCGPDTSYAAYCAIPANTAVTLISSSNGWSYVLYNGQYGYVSSSYISGGTNYNSNTYYQTGTTWYGGYNWANVYNYTYYVAHNQDVVQALGTDPQTIIQHFVNYGIHEGRQGCESFNVYTYKNNHPELQSICGSDLGNYYKYACGIPF